MELLSLEGQTMGTLAISNSGQAWGLTRFIGRRGVEVGDTLVLTMEPGLNVTVCIVGGLDLLESYSDGDGWGPAAILERLTQPREDD